MSRLLSLYLSEEIISKASIWKTSRGEELGISWHEPPNPPSLSSDATKPTQSLFRGLSAPIRKPRTELAHWLIPSPYRSDPNGPDFWSGTFPSPHNASARAWSCFRKSDGPIPCRWGPCRIHCPSKMVSSFVSLGPAVIKRNLESHTPWTDCVNTVSRPSVPLLPSVLPAVTHDVTFYWKCHLKPESRSAGNRTRMTTASRDLCPLHPS